MTYSTACLNFKRLTKDHKSDFQFLSQIGIIYAGFQLLKLAAAPVKEPRHIQKFKICLQDALGYNKRL